MSCRTFWQIAAAKSPLELAEEIRLEPTCPDDVEDNFNPSYVWPWRTMHLTATPACTYWIEYDTHVEAKEALRAARKRVAACPDGASAWAEILKIYDEA